MTSPAPRRGGRMWSFDNIRDLLSANGRIQHRSSTHFMARCPVHGDDTPSLSVTWVPDADCGGRTLLYCHGCQATSADLVAALDPSLSTSILFDEEIPEDRRRHSERVGRSPRQRRAGQRRGRGGRLPALLVKPAERPELAHDWQEVCRYGYVDPQSGHLVEEVIRLECHECTAADGSKIHQRHKTFRQEYVQPNGRRVQRKPAGFVPVLYRQQQITEAIAAGQPVWLLEGEKDCDNAVAAGDAATTNVQGGLNFPKERADVFRGATVYVVLDRDGTGYARGVQLAALLGEVESATVQLLLPATPDAKSDYSDHLSAGLRDTAKPFNGFLPVTADEVAAHELCSKMRAGLDGDTVGTVRHARLEASARMALAHDPATENPELEQQRAQKWAAEAERRFEKLADQFADVRRLAREASTPWANEAVVEAAAICHSAKAMARAAYEQTGLAVPAPLLDDDEQEPAADVEPEPTPAQRTRRARSANRSSVEPDTDEPSENDEAGRGAIISAPRYRILHGRLVEVITRDGEERANQVLSLDARIVELEYLEADDTVDVQRPKLFGRQHLDGSAEANPPAPETLSAVVIGYHHPDTGEWTLMRIPADDYRDRNCAWLESLPGPPEYDSRPNGLAKLRDALKVAAGGTIRRTLRYRSTGWRQDERGEWFFVHAGGAITAAGPRVAPVLLNGPLARFDLPAPATDPEQVRQAFLDESGALLTALPTRVTAPLLGHVFRSALGPNPWVMLLVGSPGSFKTSVASLAMHHWGELWDRRYPATSMSGNGDTFNALRIKLHATKDALFWADDVAPTRDWAGAQKALEEFARLVHNGEQRSRSSRDGQSVLEGTPPRASALVTSEVTPRPGTSGGARTFPVPMQATDIDVETLKLFDREESRFGRALVMATYLQWLAQNLDKARTLAAESSARFAEDLRRGGGAVRASEAAGEIWSGWVVLCRFLVEVDAMDESEAERLLGVATEGLLSAIDASTDPDLPATTGARVREILAHALRTGICYVDDVRTGSRPEWPLAARLGWRRLLLGEGGGEAAMRYENRGIRLGYVLLDPTGREGSEEQLLVWQSALEQVLKETTGRMTDAPQVDLATAVRALADDGILITEQNGGRPRYTVQRTLHCEGRRQRMTALRLRLLIGSDPDDGHLGVDDPDPAPQPDPSWGASLRELVTGECRGAAVASEQSDTSQDSTDPDEHQEPDMGRRFAPCEGQFELPLEADVAAAEIPVQTAAVPTAPVTSPAPKTEAAQAPSSLRVVTEQTRATPDLDLDFAVAVLDTDGVWLPDGTVRQLPEPLTHVGHIAALAENLGLGQRTTERWVESGQIWVTAGALARFGIELPTPSLDARKMRSEIAEATAGTPLVTEALQDGWRIGRPGDRLGAWTRVWRDGGRAVWIVLEAGLVHSDSDNPVLGDHPAPGTLARRLALFADATKLPFRITPQSTGFDLMSSTRRDRDEVFRATEPVGPERISACEDDIQWTRVLTEEEQHQRYVHAFDRGGSHLAGFAGLELGVGEAVHYPDGREFDEKLPGYWRVEVPAAGDWRYPHPLLPLAEEKPGLRWITTPSMKLALELDYELTVQEAWVWPKHLRVLDAFYSRLRDARAALDIDDEDAQRARDLLKATYTRTIGQMGSELYMRSKLTDPQTGKTIDGWRAGFAPHRRHHGIAKARANIIRFVHKTGTVTGRWPVAITNDTLLYVSDDPNPATAFPGDPKKWGRGLGQYKWEGSALLSDHQQYLTGGRYEGKDALCRDWDSQGKGR